MLEINDLTGSHRAGSLAAHSHAHSLATVPKGLLFSKNGAALAPV